MFDRTLESWKVENAAKPEHERLCTPSDWVDGIAANIQADLTGRLEDLRERNTLVNLAHIVDPRFRMKGIPSKDHARVKRDLATYLDVIAPSTPPTVNIPSSVELEQGLSGNQASTLPSLPTRLGL